LFWSTFFRNLNPVSLPRQARDIQREHSKKDDPFSQVGNSPNKNKTPEIWADFISFLRKAVCVGARDSLFPRSVALCI
jgi:hypothetical protein